MKCNVINLEEIYNIPKATLSSICMSHPFDKPQSWRRPAVIVVPGGGYGFVSIREGEPIATNFLSRGFQAFVLTYSTVNDGQSYPTQLNQLACAVDYIKAHAEEYNVDADQIFVVGFSAGGHLVGNLAVQWQDMEKIYGKKLNCRPTAVGLCYPVVNKEVGHKGTYVNLLAGYPDEQKQELYNLLSLDKQVTKQTPPSFVWSTFADEIVPCQNSLLYAMACANVGVQFELHVYPCGGHGLSTVDAEINTFCCEDVKRYAKWLDDCSAFFKIFIK